MANPSIRVPKHEAQLIVLSLLAIVLLSGCCCSRNWPTGPLYSENRETIAGKKDREMTALAFISYTGDLLKGDASTVEPKLRTCVEKELRTQKLTQNKWVLAWGPAVFKWEIAELDDNMMYAVQGSEDKDDTIAIVVRGTNPEAALDWLLEDFWVIPTVEWPYKKPRAHGIRISQGTHIGLEKLQAMVPKVSPLRGQRAHDIQHFLAYMVKNEGIRHVEIVGHSLGGALVPALALWLHDIQIQWDDKKQVTINVTTVAGPTAGNKRFANYYDSVLGSSTRRLYNPYDVVPLGSTVSSMQHFPGMYAPTLPAERDIELLICAASDVVRDADFTQIRKDQPSLRGGVFTEFVGGKKLSGKNLSFETQVGLQHHCGYICAMEMQIQPVESCMPNDDKKPPGPAGPCSLLDDETNKRVLANCPSYD